MFICTSRLARLACASHGRSHSLQHLPHRLLSQSFLGMFLQGFPWNWKWRNKSVNNTALRIECDFRISVTLNHTSIYHTQIEPKLTNYEKKLCRLEKTKWCFTSHNHKCIYAPNFNRSENRYMYIKFVCVY